MKSTAVRAGGSTASRPQAVAATRSVAKRHSRDVTASGGTTCASESLTKWLLESGAPPQNVQLAACTINGREIDSTVAAKPLIAGDMVLRVPMNCVVTLSRVFEDETVAELLTTDKLSELSCLALYLMYEKKRGESSVWYSYIKELDRQRGRGQYAVESPLLWTDDELEAYLQGSPVLGLVRQRLALIREQYEALDGVWFMSGSLFKNYPYDVPTEAFPFDLFKQAFAAVQSCVVHLQGVPLANRFAMVPFGPPSLSYSPSASKATVSFNAEANEVQLVADRDYAVGEPVYAWCGPQPNSRLLINYGIVDEANPYDKVPITAVIPNSDPLFRSKRTLLDAAKLSTQQVFQLQLGQPLPAQFLPYMRLCACTVEADLKRVDLTGGELFPDCVQDGTLVEHLVACLHDRLSKYPKTLEENIALAEDSSTPPRQQMGCRLVITEQKILQEKLSMLLKHPCAPATSAEAKWTVTGVRLT